MKIFTPVGVGGCILVRQVMFIGENTGSFIFKSIKDSLSALGYDSVFVAPDAKAIGAQVEKAGKIIIYGGSYLEDSPDAIVYLKDYCMETETQISIVGFPEEVDNVKNVFPEPLIHKIYERPINVKELVTYIKEDLDSEIENEHMKSVLVVDDSGTMLRTVKSWLSGKYKVSIASSATMAISFLANNTPDLILLDFEMPICSGPQLMEMIHAEPSTKDVPVIFLTSKGDIDSVKQVLKLKPEGYLLKSMKQDEIVSYIDNFFEKRKNLLH